MANVTARMRRIISDWEQLQKDFGNHRYIAITPMGPEPYERYHVTYFVNGIYLKDGKVAYNDRHEVEITLHADYPRYKPKCEILTPIYHPNFRDGQICIGDIWGAGESLSDIIVNIGDMIQYKSWNSYSPLSAEAAQWALENRDLFPVGDINLHIAEEDVTSDDFEIDLFDDFENEKIAEGSRVETVSPQVNDNSADGIMATQSAAMFTTPHESKTEENDFDITAEELEGVTYTPAAERMQSAPRGELVKGKAINFKTILTKGLMWAIIGALLGFAVTELIGKDGSIGCQTMARMSGVEYLEDYYEYSYIVNEESIEVYNSLTDYCRMKGYDPNDESSIEKWQVDASAADIDKYDQYLIDSYKMTDYLSKAIENYDGTETAFWELVFRITKISTALWVCIIALFIGLLLGIGEAVYYGSTKNILKYAIIGAAISAGIGFVSGYIAQLLYSNFYNYDSSVIQKAFIRAIAWAMFGAGIGAGCGLIKPEKKREWYCILGGAIGGFLGGFLFEIIAQGTNSGAVLRCIGLTITGASIGVFIGLLEQVAKQAWLKVIRGEFEGKEYLVFAGTTSIGNNGQNIIVLFKDKLVAPHHCDIILKENKYIIEDAGSPMGTLVNGMKISKQALKDGDSISIGNSVLVFNTK